MPYNVLPNKDVANDRWELMQKRSTASFLYIHVKTSVDRHSECSFVHISF